MMETWQILLIIGMCSSPIVLLVIGTTLTYLFNKSEFTEDHKKRRQEEIMSAIPIDSSFEFNRDIMFASIKPMLGYGLYFLISIPLLVRIFGRIQYGPNMPYTVFLIVIGIPFLICLCHVLIKVENKRIRMKAYNLKGKPIQKSIIDWIVLVPSLYVLLIIILLKVSNAIIAK